MLEATVKERARDSLQQDFSEPVDPQTENSQLRLAENYLGLKNRNPSPASTMFLGPEPGQKSQFPYLQNNDPGGPTHGLMKTKCTS